MVFLWVVSRAAGAFGGVDATSAWSRSRAYGTVVVVLARPSLRPRTVVQREERLAGAHHRRRDVVVRRARAVHPEELRGGSAAGPARRRRPAPPPPASRRRRCPPGRAGATRAGRRALLLHRAERLRDGADRRRTQHVLEEVVVPRRAPPPCRSPRCGGSPAPCARRRAGPGSSAGRSRARRASLVAAVVLDRRRAREGAASARLTSCGVVGPHRVDELLGEAASRCVGRAGERCASTFTTQAFTGSPRSISPSDAAGLRVELDDLALLVAEHHARPAPPLRRRSPRRAGAPRRACPCRRRSPSRAGSRSRTSGRPRWTAPESVAAAVARRCAPCRSASATGGQRGSPPDGMSFGVPGQLADGQR